MTTARPMRRMRQMLADRAITVGARLAGGLPDWLLGAAAGDIARAASLALRPVLRANLRGALGPDPGLRQFERDYSYRAAQWARYTALTFHRGFAASGFAEECGVLHETFAHLERAAACGRGVVLVGPHQFGHELFAALIHHSRIRLVGVIRQERNAALFERWYSQLGMPTILRPRHAGAVADFRAMLRVLRDGATLGITPDLPGAEGEGEVVQWFGRRVRFRGGAFWLALRGRAPLVHYWIDRVGPRLVCRFSPPVMIERAPGLTAQDTVQRHLQKWTTEFERELRTQPGSWAFWVDRRWTRVLRQAQDARR
jgi:lauroyl/myristoyl acyltransferase